jgi:sugar O-acyltransferase (sialic acid O-acetyltransferase NeuD family)
VTAVVLTPLVSAREDTIVLAGWIATPGQFVRKGEPICAVETHKVNVEVEAEADGYLHPLAKPNQIVTPGSPLALVMESADETPERALAALGCSDLHAPRWTKDAAVAARRVGINLETLADETPGRLIDVADVLAAQSAQQAKRPDGASARSPSPLSTDMLWGRYTHGRPERILLLGGGAGAGIVAIDTLRGMPHQRAVGILDNNPNTHGKTVAGVPVLGAIDRAEELWRAGHCDSVIILFSDRIPEREELFNRLRAKGVPFANIVDPTTQVRSHVRMGQGNLVLANGFLATCVTIGDNNFIMSHACVEHHSTVGNHCAFGPRLTTTGYVRIGDRVRIGMSVSLEPAIKIGDDASIASGCIVTHEVPDRAILKARRTHVLRRPPALAAE